DRRLLRLVEGRSGRVEMCSVMRFRFDYGWILPWVLKTDDGLAVIAGPEALRVRTPVELRGEDFTTVAEFTVSAGDRVPFEVAWHPSHERAPRAVHVEHTIEETEEWWGRWSAGCTYDGGWAAAVHDSL